MLYRQGDVLIQDVSDIPFDAAKLPHVTLAHGEITGHSHRVAEPERVELFEENGTMFLRVIQEATVIHQEHGPLKLNPGTYKVWLQREYTPQEIRIIRD